MTNNEEWRPVVGYEGLYEVSDHGRVRSLDRVINLGGNGYGGSFVKPGRVLKHQSNTQGRHQVALCGHNKQRLYQVHRLVLAAFVGPCPEGLHALHWDDDPDNNALRNLRYGTLSENQYDRVRNGNHYRANQTHCKRGHQFTVENTYRDRNGRRSCKNCHRLTERARGPRVRDRRKKAAAA